MPIESPVLDDRRFQDIVDELRKRIPEYCDEWTDINLSDPGVTLLELFAWMTETILYRVNQVPLLHYIKFMELFGVMLKPPQAAQVPVTFFFSTPQVTDLEIPSGTQVSTTQTEADPPVVFSTKENASVYMPKLTSLLSCEIDGRDSYRYRSLSSRVNTLSSSAGENIFSATPKAGDFFCFGFANDLSHHTIRIGCQVVELVADRLNEANPPWVWEVSTGVGYEWKQCELDKSNNTIGGFNRSGTIQIHLPQMGRIGLNGETCFWLRVKITDVNLANQGGGYRTSPELRFISECATIGRTIECEHAQIIKEETIGVSTGLPNQHFYLKAVPIVMPLEVNERLRVQTEGETDLDWERVESFAGKTATDRCYTLDGLSGEVRFGPAIRLQNGEIVQRGMVPPKGSFLVFERYRSGGGIVGNVDPKFINTLKTSIPYVSRVINRKKAVNGLDAQSVEEAMLEMPKRLRSRERAVTKDDFESLVEEHFSGTVSRAICLDSDLPSIDGVETIAEANRVDVRIIPKIESHNTLLETEPAALQASSTLCEQVHRFLDDRRLLTTRLTVKQPQFQWVVVEVEISTHPGANTAALNQILLRRLYRFLNPITGGTDGAGWPIGRDLQDRDIYQYLRTEKKTAEGQREQLDLLRVEDMKIYLFAGETDGSASKGRGAVPFIEVPLDGLIVSGRHYVRFTSS